jgi:hypothetical protein
MYQTNKLLLTLLKFAALPLSTIKQPTLDKTCSGLHRPFQKSCLIVLRKLCQIWGARLALALKKSGHLVWA